MPQCQARHGQKMYLRCQDEVTEMTVHTGLHWAVDRDGQTVRWDALVAMYPAIDGNFRNSEAFERDQEEWRAAISSVNIANPDRTTVGNGSARLGQVGGEHYKKFKIQPWDVIDEYGLSFYAGSALKYLLRAGNKGSTVEDLKKCRHYLDKLIEIEEAKE